jgi:hypothetical protein
VPFAHPRLDPRRMADRFVYHGDGVFVYYAMRDAIDAGHFTDEPFVTPYADFA